MLRLFVTLILLISAPAFAAPERCVDLFREPIRLSFEGGTITVDSPAAFQAFDDAAQLERGLKARGDERKALLARFFSPAPSARWERALVFVNYAMSMKIAWDVAVKYAQNPHALVAGVVAVPVSMFAADFMSAMLHKFFDSWAPTKDNVIGKAALSFRLHHDVPTDMNGFTYMQNVTHYSKLMAPLYATTMMASPHIDPATSTGLLVSLLLFSNGNEFHVQAHRGSQASGWAKVAQKLRLSLRPGDHARHHRGATDVDYGIINGWSNAPTRRLWKHLDRIYWHALKKMPENWIENPKTIPDSVVRELVNDLGLVPQELFVHLARSKNPDPRMDDIVRLYIERQIEEARP